MDLEYFPFDVMPFLKQKKQPVFMLKDLNPFFRYWVPTSLAPFTFINAKAPSSGVRVPVFAVASDSGNTELSSGSLLFGLGLENALTVVRALGLKEGIPPGDILSVSVVLAKDCHVIGDKCRSYFGIALGVKDDEK